MLILSFHSQLAAAIISFQNDTDRATASTAEWKTISKRKLSGRVRKDKKFPADQFDEGPMNSQPNFTHTI